MSLLIYAHYDSVDAAELGAMRLKNRVSGIRVAGISKNHYADETEETTLSVFPAYGGGAEAAPSGGTAFAPYGAFLSESVQDDRIEPSERGDAFLRVEAEDAQTAQRTASLLRSTGGREIRICEK